MDKSNQDIYEILIAWIRLAIGDPSFAIIVANQDGRQPTGEFASLIVQSRATVGLGAVKNDLSDDELTVDLHQTGLTNADISLQFYRGNAHEYARKVLFFPNTNASYNFLFSKNVSLNVPNNYNTLDEPSGGTYIPRTQIDLLLQSSTEYVETVNVIEEVDITIN